LTTFDRSEEMHLSFYFKTRAYQPFLLNSRALGVSVKNEQPTQIPWRGTHCGLIGLRLVLMPGKFRKAGFLNVSTVFG